MKVIDDQWVCYTLLVPYVPAEFATAWHPTEPTGPFATLNRGAFDTAADAIRWGREHLRGTPYSVRRETIPRKLTLADVTVELRAEEEHVPVRGNAMASDDELDKQVEDEILDRLARGERWAWCCIIAEARWGDHVGYASLGCCSYADEADLKQPGGYYEGMVEEALDGLNAKVAATYAEIEPLLTEES